MTGWEVWRLPPALRWYVTGVVTAAAAAAGAAAARTSWRPGDVILFAALACFGAAALELTRRVREPAGLIKDVHGIWQLPMALLLPPVYSLIAPVITFALLQARTPAPSRTGRCSARLRPVCPWRLVQPSSTWPPCLLLTRCCGCWPPCSLRWCGRR